MGLRQKMSPAMKAVIKIPEEQNNDLKSHLMKIIEAFKEEMNK